MQLSVGEVKRVRVDSREYWNDTQIDVAPGEEYAFAVEGKQTWHDASHACGADGYTAWVNTLAGPFKRFRDKLFTLVGAVDKRHDFRIGSSNPSWKPAARGRLFAYANDVRGFYKNNRGALELTVTRVR
jgi:hypothetical protein